MRILIVEDEPYLAEAVGQLLRQAQYAVDIVENGQDGLDWALSGAYDAVVLDIMLPELDGFAVLRGMREAAIDTPTLMLTARDEVADKIHGLNGGADDYMTKPFAPEELLARVRALTRRQDEVVAQVLCFDDLTLNLSTYMLQCGTKSVRLGLKEFQILQLLMQNPTMYMPKDTIIRRVWEEAQSVEENSVEAYLSFLRKKFAYLHSRVTIQVARAIGYRLEVRT